MLRIDLDPSRCLSDEAAEALAGDTPADGWLDLVLTEDTTVYKPDGSLLCILRKNVLPAGLIAPAHRVLRTLRDKATNRRTSTQGAKDVALHPTLKDGRISKTVRLPPDIAPVSSIIGYFERTPRFPYCRQTRFNMDKPGKFAEALPFIQAVDRVFAENVPDRYAVQREYTARTSKDFVIHGTAFTTVTVNLNYPTAVHKDAGDLKEGFSCLTVIRAGQFSGGVLCFPQFRVGADLQTGDVLLMDAHEWHSNTPIQGVPGAYERLSCVMYYREKMTYCGSAAAELNFAKNRKPGEQVIRAGLSDGRTTNMQKGEQDA